MSAIPPSWSDDWSSEEDSSYRFSVSSADILRCPHRTISASHYRTDGSCLCVSPRGCGHPECADEDGHSDGCRYDVEEDG